MPIKRTAYITIPPPPLPEFYTTEQRSKESSSSESSSSAPEVDAQAIVLKTKPSSHDGANDVKPRGSRLAAPAAVPLMTMPGAAGNDVPPLAIYHICRICLRPRSPRYHREHPIPVDGVPPPPGICRRCRVTTVEETQEVEVITESRSNDIKIGVITPFVKDADIVSNEEMRRM